MKRNSFSVLALIAILICTLGLSGCFSSSSNTPDTGGLTGHIYLYKHKDNQINSLNKSLYDGSEQIYIGIPKGITIDPNDPNNPFEPLNDRKAIVSVSGPSNKSVKLSDDGSFLITGLRAGKYKISISHPQFNTFTSSETYVVSPGIITDIDQINSISTNLGGFKYLVSVGNSEYLDYGQRLYNAFQNNNRLAHQVVYNSTFSENSIKNAIIQIGSSSTELDTLIFTFTGNGTVIKEGNEFFTCFIPYDGISSPVKFSHIVNWIREYVNCKDVILILDVAFEGKIDLSILNRSLNKQIQTRGVNINPTQTLTILNTSAKNSIYPGLFTKHMVLAFENNFSIADSIFKDKDGIITLEELFYYVGSMVYNATSEKQEPEILSNAAESEKDRLLATPIYSQK